MCIYVSVVYDDEKFPSFFFSSFVLKLISWEISDDDEDNVTLESECSCSERIVTLRIFSCQINTIQISCMVKAGF